MWYVLLDRAWKTPCRSLPSEAKKKNKLGGLGSAKIVSRLLQDRGWTVRSDQTWKATGKRPTVTHRILSNMRGKYGGDRAKIE